MPAKKTSYTIGREASRFIERYTPGTNLWQTRLLEQRLLWNNLRRLLDPEAEKSFQRQAVAPWRWGSEYYWAPGDILPNGPGGYGAVDELGLPKRRGLSRMQSELGLGSNR
jgi:hypothetical protein